MGAHVDPDRTVVGTNPALHAADGLRHHATGGDRIAARCRWIRSPTTQNWSGPLDPLSLLSMPFPTLPNRQTCMVARFMVDQPNPCRAVAGVLRSDMRPRSLQPAAYTFKVVESACRLRVGNDFRKKVPAHRKGIVDLGQGSPFSSHFLSLAGVTGAVKKKVGKNKANMLVCVRLAMLHY